MGMRRHKGSMQAGGKRRMGGAKKRGLVAIGAKVALNPKRMYGKEKMNQAVAVRLGGTSGNGYS